LADRERRAVTAPAASLGVGIRRPDSIYVDIRVRPHWIVIHESLRLIMDALCASSSALGEGNITVPESKIGFDRHSMECSQVLPSPGKITGGGAAGLPFVSVGLWRSFVCDGACRGFE
jgi:hypothetical protein